MKELDYMAIADTSMAQIKKGAFLTVAAGYPYKQWQARAQLEAGRCLIELGSKEKAATTLQVVVDKQQLLQQQQRQSCRARRFRSRSRPGSTWRAAC